MRFHEGRGPATVAKFRVEMVMLLPWLTHAVSDEYSFCMMKADNMIAEPCQAAASVCRQEDVQEEAPGRRRRAQLCAVCAGAPVQDICPGDCPLQAPEPRPAGGRILAHQRSASRCDHLNLRCTQCMLCSLTLQGVPDLATMTSALWPSSRMHPYLRYGSQELALRMRH